MHTKKSVLRQIENENKACGSKPSQVLDKVCEDCAGVAGVTSCGSVPQNKKQISNIKMKKSVKEEPGVANHLLQ